MTLDQAIHEHVVKLPAQAQGEVLDYVLHLEQKAHRQATDDNQRRQKLTLALERLVAAAPFADVDAAEWEREQRRERPLPGRD